MGSYWVEEYTLYLYTLELPLEKKKSLLNKLNNYLGQQWIWGVLDNQGTLRVQWFSNHLESLDSVSKFIITMVLQML